MSTARPFETMLWIVAFLTLLASAAVLRFSHITTVGIGGWMDNYQYHWIARDILEGLPLGNVVRYHPAAHVFNALGMLVLGVNDYSIKIVNISFDLLAMALVCLLSYQLLKNKWLSLFPVLFMVFCPFLLFYARGELPHSPSAFWLLLAITLLIFALERKVWWGQWGLLAASGAAYGTACSTHPTLPFFGPGLALLLFCETWQGGSWTRWALLRAFTRTTAYTLATLGCMFLWAQIYTPEARMDYIQRIRTVDTQSAPDWSLSREPKTKGQGFEDSVPEAAFVWTSLACRILSAETTTSDVSLVYPPKHSVLFVGFLALFPVLVFLAHRYRTLSRTDRLIFYLSLLPPLFATIFFLQVHVVTVKHLRYLIPVSSLFLIINIYVPYRFVSSFGKRRLAVFVTVLYAAVLYASLGQTYFGAPTLEAPQNPMRAIYNHYGKTPTALDPETGEHVPVIDEAHRLAFFSAEKLHYGVPTYNIRWADLYFYPEFFQPEVSGPIPEGIRGACGVAMGKVPDCGDGREYFIQLPGEIPEGETVYSFLRKNKVSYVIFNFFSCFGNDFSISHWGPLWSYLQRMPRYGEIPGRMQAVYMLKDTPVAGYISPESIRERLAAVHNEMRAKDLLLDWKELDDGVFEVTLGPKARFAIYRGPFVASGQAQTAGVCLWADENRACKLRYETGKGGKGFASNEYEASTGRITQLNTTPTEYTIQHTFKNAFQAARVLLLNEGAESITFYLKDLRLTYEVHPD